MIATTRSTPWCIWPPSGPGLLTNSATFANNMVVSHNVFAPRGRPGSTTWVWASSETVLGLPFETPPPYVPVDEEYAPAPSRHTPW